MYRFIQFDAVTGRLVGSMDSCRLDAEGQPIAPEGRIVIDTIARPEAASALAYDARADTFTIAPAPVAVVTKADVVAALTPAQWAEMNRFHPNAVGTSSAGTPYNDPDVFWAVSVFNAAMRPFPLDDPRITLVMQALVRARVLTDVESATLLARLALP